MLYGYGIRVTMQAGHLQIEDGIGPERRKFRLPRVGHKLKRLVCIGDDGFLTLSALRWLTETGASFVMLDRMGKVRVVTGPTSASEARLRRAQALALANGTAALIARELISAKLTGQETLVREKLKNANVAASISALQDRLSNTESIDGIRAIEARAASEYWSAWRDVPVLFPRKDVARIPAHWLTFGPRHSPLTGGPRLSVNPANSLLNYINAIAESECRLAATACGLDPGIGFVHTDTANRDSLALDLIETIRPAIEAWLLDWLMREPLQRSDFSESTNGNCRISCGCCSKLSETAPIWGKLVAPWAEYVAHALLLRTGQSRSVRGLRTPLTQSRRREAKGVAPLITQFPKVQHVCRGCGKPLGKEHQNCGNCFPPKQAMIAAARLGRVTAKMPKARSKHAESIRRQAIARYAWDSSTQPSWLTAECFSKEIQPRLGNLSSATIESLLGVSRYYASKIRQGFYRPHPRHWKALADLSGVTSNAEKLS
ncbi:MAG: CRISPR-associated endonuclease Cas1 [Terriglobales bacterium]